MKKLIVFLAAIIFLAASCSSVKSARSERADERKLHKLAEQEAIRKAVEAGQFSISLQRLHLTRGGIIELLPSRNFIIIDDDKVVMRAGYVGRNYGVMPVQGIKLAGKKTRYQLESNPQGDGYEIDMDVERGGNHFQIVLRISRDGYCSATIDNIRLDHTRYSGIIDIELVKLPEISQEGTGREAKI